MSCFPDISQEHGTGGNGVAAHLAGGVLGHSTGGHEGLDTEGEAGDGGGIVGGVTVGAAVYS